MRGNTEGGQPIQEIQVEEAQVPQPPRAMAPNIAPPAAVGADPVVDPARQNPPIDNPEAQAGVPAGNVPAPPAVRRSIYTPQHTEFLQAARRTAQQKAREVVDTLDFTGMNDELKAEKKAAIIDALADHMVTAAEKASLDALDRIEQDVADPNIYKKLKDSKLSSKRGTTFGSANAVDKMATMTAAVAGIPRPKYSTEVTNEFKSNLKKTKRAIGDFTQQQLSAHLPPAVVVNNTKLLEDAWDNYVTTLNQQALATDQSISAVQESSEETLEKNIQTEVLAEHLKVDVTYEAGGENQLEGQLGRHNLNEIKEAKASFKTGQNTFGKVSFSCNKEGIPNSFSLASPQNVSHSDIITLALLAKRYSGGEISFKVPSGPNADIDKKAIERIAKQLAKEGVSTYMGGEQWHPDDKVKAREAKRQREFLSQNAGKIDKIGKRSRKKNGNTGKSPNKPSKLTYEYATGVIDFLYQHIDNPALYPNAERFSVQKIKNLETKINADVREALDNIPDGKQADFVRWFNKYLELTPAEIAAGKGLTSNDNLQTFKAEAEKKIKAHLWRQVYKKHQVINAAVDMVKQQVGTVKEPNKTDNPNLLPTDLETLKDRQEEVLELLKLMNYAYEIALKAEEKGLPEVESVIKAQIIENLTELLKDVKPLSQVEQDQLASLHGKEAFREAIINHLRMYGFYQQCLALLGNTKGPDNQAAHRFFAASGTKFKSSLDFATLKAIFDSAISAVAVQQTSPHMAEFKIDIPRGQPRPEDKEILMHYMRSNSIAANAFNAVIKYAAEPAPRNWDNFPQEEFNYLCSIAKNNRHPAQTAATQALIALEKAYNAQFCAALPDDFKLKHEDFLSDDANQTPSEILQNHYVGINPLIAQYQEQLTAFSQSLQQISAARQTGDWDGVVGLTRSLLGLPLFDGDKPNNAFKIIANLPISFEEKERRVTNLLSRLNSDIEAAFPGAGYQFSAVGFQLAGPAGGNEVNDDSVSDSVNGLYNHLLYIYQFHRVIEKSINLANAIEVGNDDDIMRYRQQLIVAETAMRNNDTDPGDIPWRLTTGFTSAAQFHYVLDQIVGENQAPHSRTQIKLENYLDKHYQSKVDDETLLSRSFLLQGLQQFTELQILARDVKVLMNDITGVNGNPPALGNIAAHISVLRDPNNRLTVAGYPDVCQWMRDDVPDFASLGQIDDVIDEICGDEDERSPVQQRLFISLGDWYVQDGVPNDVLLTRTFLLDGLANFAQTELTRLLQQDSNIAPADAPPPPLAQPQNSGRVPPSPAPGQHNLAYAAVAAPLRHLRTNLSLSDIVTVVLPDPNNIYNPTAIVGNIERVLAHVSPEALPQVLRVQATAIQSLWPDGIVSIDSSDTNNFLIELEFALRIENFAAYFARQEYLTQIQIVGGASQPWEMALNAICQGDVLNDEGAFAVLLISTEKVQREQIIKQFNFHNPSLPIDPNWTPTNGATAEDALEEFKELLRSRLEAKDAVSKIKEVSQLLQLRQPLSNETLNRLRALLNEINQLKILNLGGNNHDGQTCRNYLNRELSLLSPGTPQLINSNDADAQANLKQACTYAFLSQVADKMVKPIVEGIRGAPDAPAIIAALNPGNKAGLNNMIDLIFNNPNISPQQKAEFAQIIEDTLWPARIYGENRPQIDPTDADTFKTSLNRALAVEGMGKIIYLTKEKVDSNPTLPRTQQIPVIIKKTDESEESFNTRKNQQAIAVTEPIRQVYNHVVNTTNWTANIRVNNSTYNSPQDPGTNELQQAYLRQVSVTKGPITAIAADPVSNETYFANYQLKGDDLAAVIGADSNSTLNAYCKNKIDIRTNQVNAGLTAVVNIIHEKLANRLLIGGEGHPAFTPQQFRDHLMREIKNSNNEDIKAFSKEFDNNPDLQIQFSTALRAKMNETRATIVERTGNQAHNFVKLMNAWNNAATSPNTAAYFPGVNVSDGGSRANVRFTSGVTNLDSVLSNITGFALRGCTTPVPAAEHRSIPALDGEAPPPNPNPDAETPTTFSFNNNR